MPRTKGSMNHTTRETKEFLNLIIKNEHLRIKEALLDLFESNKSNYLNAMIKLIPFVTPKASESNLQTFDLHSQKPSWFDEIPAGSEGNNV